MPGSRFSSTHNFSLSFFPHFIFFASPCSFIFFCLVFFSPTVFRGLVRENRLGEYYTARLLSTINYRGRERYAAPSVLIKISERLFNSARRAGRPVPVSPFRYSTAVATYSPRFRRVTHEFSIARSEREVSDLLASKLQPASHYYRYSRGDDWNKTTDKLNFCTEKRYTKFQKNKKIICKMEQF